MPARKKNTDDIFVAKTSFACEVDGEKLFINKGDKVRVGHALLRSQGDNFEPADQTVKYDVPEVEQATAGPGEKRG